MSTRRAFLHIQAGIAAERLAFYAFLAVYSLYELSLGHTEDEAHKAVARVLTLVYGSTFLGGWAGQRWGFRCSALGGAAILGVCYLALALGAPAWAWCSLMAVGIGLFKPSLPILVAQAHWADPQDRRDAAMLRFYGAVNIGGFAGPVLAGALAAVGRFREAFLMCAGSVLLAAVSIWSGWGHLGPPSTDQLVARALSSGAAADVVPRSYVHRRRAAVLLLILSVVFWTGYNSFFGSVETWIDKSVDRHLGHFLVPTAWYSAQNGALILLAAAFAPAWMGRWPLGLRLWFGLLCAAAAFVWLHVSVTHGWLLVWVPAIAILAETVGELAVSPMGVSRMISMAPPGRSGMYTVAWYMSTSLGGWLSGQVTGFGALALLSTSGAVAAWIGFKVFERAEREAGNVACSCCGCADGCDEKCELLRSDCEVHGAMSEEVVQ